MRARQDDGHRQAVDLGVGEIHITPCGNCTIVTEKGPSLGRNDIVRSERVAPVPAVKGGMGDQSVETAPKSESRDNDHHGEHGAK